MSEYINTWIKRSRKTVIEMLHDRKYDLSAVDNILVDDINFDIYEKADNLDIHVKNSDREIYVKFIKIPKAKPQTLRDLISKINTEILSLENKKILIVLLTKPNNTVLKIKNEPFCDNIELFWIGHLLVNITKHTFVPRHELLDKSLHK